MSDKMVGRDIKKEILEEVRKAVVEYQQDEKVTTVFGEPVIIYANADDVLFDAFAARGECEHPKKIYKPCHTVILHYVPFDEKYVGTREAFFDSLHLSMRINQVLRELLGDVGRLVSNASSGVSWDKKNCREGWSGKIAAYVAGAGQLGPCGSLHTKDGYGLRVGALLTDGWYFEESNEYQGEEIDRIFREAMTACCYEGADDVHCSQEMIASCPGCAISESGIDRAKCQDYCMTLNQYTPSPDMCGKCYKFR